MIILLIKSPDMKLILTLLLLIVANAISLAQSTFPTSNAIWSNYHYISEEDEEFPWLHNTTLEGVKSYCMGEEDTLINNLVYDQIHYCRGGYKGATRSEDNKVFYVPGDSLNEFLLYDFGLALGDSAIDVYFETFNFNYGHLAILSVNNVDSVLINNTYRKRIYFDGGMNEWIEGIGNTGGLFLESGGNVSGYYDELACLSINDTTIFPEVAIGTCEIIDGIQKNQRLIIEVYPNPVKGDKLHVNMGQAHATSITLFNNMGQMVEVHLEQFGDDYQIDTKSIPSGIYFLKIKDGNNQTQVEKIMIE